jgi:hypothetical protein
MNHCRDCKWISRGFFETLAGIYAGAKCTNPKIGKEAIRTDPITGKIEGGDWEYCSVNRMHISDNCGYEGNMWEQNI